MTFQFSIRAILVALLLVLMPGLAAAQGYVGVGVGFTRADVGNDEETDSGVLLSLDDQSNGFTVYGGVMLDDHVGIEGFYADLGSYEFTADGRAFYNIDVSSLGVAARFISDPNPSGVRVFGRIGIESHDAEASPTDACNGCPTITYDDTGLMAGFGLAFTQGSGYWIVGLDYYDESEVTLAYVGGQISLAPRN